jgi:hypothetical protein
MSDVVVVRVVSAAAVAVQRPGAVPSILTAAEPEALL